MLVAQCGQSVAARGRPLAFVGGFLLPGPLTLALNLLTEDSGRESMNAWSFGSHHDESSTNDTATAFWT